MIMVKVSEDLNGGDFGARMWGRLGFWEYQNRPYKVAPFIFGPVVSTSRQLLDPVCGPETKLGEPGKSKFGLSLY